MNDLRWVGVIVLVALVGSLMGIGIVAITLSDNSQAPSSRASTTESRSRDTRQRTESSAPERTLASVVPGGTIGYLGCSNTEQSVEGYRQVVRDPLFWAPYPGEGGDVLRWAGVEDQMWRGFDAQLAANDPPTGIWFQACETEDRPVTYEQLVTALANLRTRLDEGTPVWLSSLNSYDPADQCERLGVDGTSDIDEMVERAVAEGLATAGPELGPLSEPTTRGDGCHPNRSGITLLGTQLEEFFGEDG